MKRISTSTYLRIIPWLFFASGIVSTVVAFRDGHPTRFEIYEPVFYFSVGFLLTILGRYAEKRRNSTPR